MGVKAGARILRRVLFAVLCAAAAQAAAQGVTTELEVAGEVNASLQLTVDNLRAIAVRRIAD